MSAVADASASGASSQRASRSAPSRSGRALCTGWRPRLPELRPEPGCMRLPAARGHAATSPCPLPTRPSSIRVCMHARQALYHSAHHDVVRLPRISATTVLCQTFLTVVHMQRFGARGGSALLFTLLVPQAPSRQQRPHMGGATWQSLRRPATPGARVLPSWLLPSKIPGDSLGALASSESVAALCSRPVLNYLQSLSVQLGWYRCTRSVHSSARKPARHLRAFPSE